MPTFLTETYFTRCQTFPEDFNFLKAGAGYVSGMSVAPYMMNRVSKQIEMQLLNKLGKIKTKK